MRHPIRSSLLAALLAAACCPPLGAQTVVGPAGVYTVQTPGSTKIEYGDGWVKISWANDPAPNPSPAPTPGPTPDPAPAPTPPPAPVATGKLYVTLVYDADAETQDQATMRADLATAAEWAGLDAVFRAYEVKQKAIDQLNLRGSVAALPCVIVQELKPGATSAPVVKTLATPGGKDAVVTALKDLRGVKK